MNSEFDLTTQEYVEIIHELQKENDSARVSDIARKRGVTRSSVSTALNVLKRKDLIIHSNYGRVELTEQGEDLAQMLEKNHSVLRKFLINILGIDWEVADSEACKIEHHVSEQTIDALVSLIRFIDLCPYGNIEWLKIFKQKGRKMQGEAQCPFYKADTQKEYPAKL
jgi:DtxR family Mn-dependent transcriptional regulator